MTVKGQYMFIYFLNENNTIFIVSIVDANYERFILNTDSEYAKKLIYADVWNTELDDETLTEFLDYRYYPKFLSLRFEKDASTTDRESAIMFGLPSNLIEGVLVGRKFENDNNYLEFIKRKLPDCYICNIEGKVIVGNK